MDYGSGVWVGVDFSFRWLLELSGKISWESTLRHCINIGTEAPPQKKRKKKEKQTNKQTNKKTQQPFSFVSAIFPPNVTQPGSSWFPRLFSLCYKNGKYKTGGGLKVWEWVGQINRRNQAGLTCSTTSSWPPLSPSLVAGGVHPHSLDGDWTSGQIDNIHSYIEQILHVPVSESIYNMYIAVVVACCGNPWASLVAWERGYPWAWAWVKHIHFKYTQTCILQCTCESGMPFMDQSSPIPRP